MRKRYKLHRQPARAQVSLRISAVLPESLQFAHTIMGSKRKHQIKKTPLCCACPFEPQHDKTNKMACAPSEYSDQPGQMPSPIGVFAVLMKIPWALSYPLNAQRRLLSDWVVAQVDLNIRWAHRPYCWFCHAVAHCMASLHRANFELSWSITKPTKRTLSPAKIQISLGIHPVAWSGSSVRCMSDWYSGCCGFYPLVQQQSFLEIVHEIISKAIFSLPQI